MTASSSDTTAATFKLGVVGVDSSHFPEFTRRIKALNEAGETNCLVTHYWTDGQHDMPADEVAKWVEDSEAMGVQKVESMDELTSAADGLLVLTVNGNKHCAQGKICLESGKPTYIDKPLTCDAAEAEELLAVANEHGTQCYSASSLRFTNEVKAIHAEYAASLGQLVAIDAFGPGELHDLMPGTFFYGVHTIEMVDAIWGGGVSEVRAESGDDRDIVQLKYTDDRLATLRLERVGSYDFGATVHGKEGLHHFKVDFSTVYDRLVAGMVGFFEKGEAPAELSSIVENVKVMAAANESMASDGKWVLI